jgi:serine/threonine-protein kinase HipA
MPIGKGLHGVDHHDGVSYLELVEFLISNGADVATDLTELWRRIVFNICVSNTDDHLRNHGFLLTPTGWRLSPGFDLNPIAFGQGLKLNISETDNALDLTLALQVAPYFRLTVSTAETILAQVVDVVRRWRAVAERYAIPRSEQEMLADAFRAVEA